MVDLVFHAGHGRREHDAMGIPKGGVSRLSAQNEEKEKEEASSSSTLFIRLSTTLSSHVRLSSPVTFSFPPTRFIHAACVSHNPNGLSLSFFGYQFYYHHCNASSQSPHFSATNSAPDQHWYLLPLGNCLLFRSFDTANYDLSQLSIQNAIIPSDIDERAQIQSSHTKLKRDSYRHLYQKESN